MHVHTSSLMSGLVFKRKCFGVRWWENVMGNLKPDLSQGSCIHADIHRKGKRVEDGERDERKK